MNRVRRWLAHRAELRSTRAYDAHYDAYFDVAADRWLEPPCGDRSCGYCLDRPERPSQSPFRSAVMFPSDR